MKLLRIQMEDAIEALAEEREKYEELEKICRAQHEAINACADHLREAHLALMAFIDAKSDIYQESRKRAKARKRISNVKVRGCALLRSPSRLPGYACDVVAVSASFLAFAISSSKLPTCS